jgi:hypothetical protein
MSLCADDGKLIPTIGSITTSHKTHGSLMASLFNCKASAAGEVFPQAVQGWEGGTNFSTSQFPRETYLEVPASSPSGLHEQHSRQDRQGRAWSLAKSIITIRELIDCARILNRPKDKDLMRSWAQSHGTEAQGAFSLSVFCIFNAARQSAGPWPLANGRPPESPSSSGDVDRPVNEKVYLWNKRRHTASFLSSQNASPRPNNTPTLSQIRK